ncbi:tail assembly chaperone, partial [Bacillus cereus]
MFFEIEGKEYELKLTYKAISEINKKYKGGAQEIVSVAMLGDLEIFEDAIYYGLLHTEQGFTREKIQDALEKLMEKQVLTQE